MDISIIIVNWNTKNLVLNCLQSIRDQRITHSHEIIVVDNASEDGSQQAISNEFPEVRIIQNSENLGFGKANNIGIALSSGRYICLVNSDVQLIDNCLQNLVAYMDSKVTVGMTGPQILYPDLTVQDSCRYFPSLWRSFCSSFMLNRLFSTRAAFSGEHMFHFAHDQEINPDYLAGCLLMIRRTALDQIGGGFDERFFIYAEEVDLARRLRSSGWAIAFLPQSKAVHHHAGSSSKDPLRFLLAQQKSVLQYWHKHHNFLEFTLFKSLLILKNTLQLCASALMFCGPRNQRKKSLFRIKRNIFLLKELINN